MNTLSNQNLAPAHQYYLIVHSPTSYVVTTLLESTNQKILQLLASQCIINIGLIA